MWVGPLVPSAVTLALSPAATFSQPLEPPMELELAVKGYATGPRGDTNGPSVEVMKPLVNKLRRRKDR